MTGDERTEALTALIARFARHARLCQRNYGDQECTCGLDAAKRKAQII